jgi:hypothetical protein
MTLGLSVTKPITLDAPSLLTIGINCMMRLMSMIMNCFPPSFEFCSKLVFSIFEMILMLNVIYPPNSLVPSQLSGAGTGTMRNRRSWFFILWNGLFDLSGLLHI